MYRRKAVAKDWFPNGFDLTVRGKLEFLQQTEYDITDVEVGLEGLDDVSGYHIHMVRNINDKITKQFCNNAMF